MITDDFCISLFYDGDRMTDLKHKRTIFNENPGIKDYLENRFPDTLDTSEILFRIKNKIDKPPVCLCGKKLKYNKHDKKYNSYCSAKCQNSDPQKIKKDKNTKKEKYGDENYNNHLKNVETCLKKYGVSSFTKTKDFLKKCKETNNEKYGADWGLQTKRT